MKDGPKMKPFRPPSLFKGYWHHRVENLNICGANFFERRVLDVGCSMGIIAYEVCKYRPSFYHGVDLSEPHINVAEGIALGIETPTLFEALDVGEVEPGKWMKKEGYDITLYLATRQHVLSKHGKAAVKRLDKAICSKSRIIVFRGTDQLDFEHVAEQHEMTRRGTFMSSYGLAPLVVFAR